MLKQELILKLQKSFDELGHSPQRREIPRLAHHCYKLFGSFNKAKTEAGLDIKNVKITKFPKNAFRLDKALAAIISYLTFDGHLYKNFKGMMFSSKNIKDLQDFAILMNKKFGLKGTYYLFSSGGGRYKTHKICFFSKKVAEYLFKQGLPKGDKAIQSFNVPNWIKNSKEFSREYIKIAFFCEGSMKENDRKNPRISFVQSKDIGLIKSGLNFMNTLRKMIVQFGISTTDCYLSGWRIRKKDKRITRDMRFRVMTRDNQKFISEIGWLK